MKQEAVEDTLPVNENIISTKIEPETEEVKNDVELIQGADKPETIGETIPVEEVLSVQEESPLEENSTAEELLQSPEIMITSEATGKVEEKAGLVEVMKGFIKEDDKTQREEIESKIETGIKVSPAIKKTCEASFINYSRKHGSFHNDSGLFIPLSTNAFVMEESNTHINLAL